MTEITVFGIYALVIIYVNAMYIAYFPDITWGIDFDELISYSLTFVFLIPGLACLLTDITQAIYSILNILLLFI